MAIWHVLPGDSGVVRLVCHFPAPVGDNQANPPISHALAAKRFGLSGTTVLPDGDGLGGTISAAEKTAILDGTTLEKVVGFDLGNDWESLSAVQQRNRADAIQARVAADETARLSRVLRYAGYTRV